MSSKFDFKKEWTKTKKQLVELSQKAAVLAKKGEEEVVEFSKKSMLHIDSTATGVKMERLYYLIGKEYVKAEESQKLKDLVAQVHKLEEEQKSLKGKIKSEHKKTVRKKKTAKKSAGTAKKTSSKPSEDA